MIVNSFNSIASAANSAKSAIDRLKIPSDIQADDLLTTDIGKNVGKNLNDLQQQSQRYRLIDLMTGRIYKDSLTYDEALELQKDQNVARHTKIEKYASGTRNAKEGLRVINEEGTEITLSKLSSGNYAIGNAGDQILNKDEADNIFEWAKINPMDMFPVNMAHYLDDLRARSMPILPNNVNNNSINNHYDSMFAFNGAVIDAERHYRWKRLLLKLQTNGLTKAGEKLVIT